MHPERRHVNVGPRKVRAIRTMSPIRISREPDTLEKDSRTLSYQRQPLESLVARVEFNRGSFDAGTLKIQMGILLVTIPSAVLIDGYPTRGRRSRD